MFGAPGSNGQIWGFLLNRKETGRYQGVPRLLKEEQRQLKQSSIGRKTALQSGVVLQAWENTWNVLLLHWFQPRFKCPERIWKVASTTGFLKTAMFRFGWG